MTSRNPSNSTRKAKASKRSTNGRVERFHVIVFEWFAKHKRDLPWRRTTDPYAIALSEMMLQQTQVDRVIPKWRAFLLAFPTWADLAAASTADVLRLWQGLGYNRRAVMLHRLAKAVIDLGGELPNDIHAMKQLPGIGEYTASAIAAFAFRNSDAAPVDTNILRIFRRVFPRHKSDPKSMQQLAQSIAPVDVWTWNHALMDIGALHCSARGHIWGLCPLASLHGSKEPKCIPPPYEGGGKGEVRSTKRVPIKFETTDRYFRGRIVDALREGSMTLKALRARSPMNDIDEKRFTTLIAKLVDEGIVEPRGNKVFLAGDEHQ